MLRALNYLLFILSCLCGFLATANVANNTNAGIWDNAFLDDPLLIYLYHFGEKSYYTPKLKLTFIEAYQFCKNIGMNLVRVQSSQEVDALTTFVQQKSAEQIFWTSGSRLVDNKNWIWMTTMRVVEYTKWSAGQPDLLGEQCLELWFAGTKELYFNNRDCNAKQAFICEIDKQTECSSTLETPNIDPNINLLHLEGKTYYFGTTFKVTFLQANQFCKMIQMELVSINSESENNGLHKYLRDTIAEGNLWSSGIKLDNGKFVWLSTRTTIGYSNWIPGAPNNVNENCLELVYNRNEGLRWNDLNCDTKLFFICERYDEPIFKPKPTTGQLVGNSDCLPPPVKQYISPNVNLLHFKKKSYYFSTFMDTFFQASEFCGMIGMKLVSINSEEENKILYKYIRETVSGSPFWSSGYRLINGKKFIWLSTGRTLDYTKWKLGEPSDVNERCLQFIPNKDEGLFWNDSDCEVKFFFICERYYDNFLHGNESVFAPKPTRTTLIEDDEYTDHYPENPSLPLTIVRGKKFRLSKFKATQQKASQTCRQYGMELVSIPNKANNDIVNELIQRYDSNPYYWTSGIKQSGRWTWSSLQPIVYTNWNDGEPNNESNELCLQLYSSGQWGGVRCDSELHFICENSNTIRSGYCGSQAIPVIHVHVNSNQGSDGDQTNKINCTCDEEGDYFDIIPRK